MRMEHSDTYLLVYIIIWKGLEDDNGKLASSEKGEEFRPFS